MAPTAVRRPPLDLQPLRVAMQLTLIAPFAGVAALTVATKTDLAMGRFTWSFTALVIVATLATLAPWGRLLASRWGTPLLLVWAIVALGTVSVGVWATGGARSPLVLLFALTTIFFAVAFSLRTQLVLLALTGVAYVVAIRPAQPGVVPLLALFAVAFLASFLVDQVRSGERRAVDATEEARRRWALLATVSAAAREMSASDVDADEVLLTVIGAVEGMGFSATIVMFGEGGPRQLPDALETPGVEPTIVAAAQRRSVVRWGRPGRRQQTGVAVPIPVTDGVAAVLVVESGTNEAPTDDDIEVFEMLASQASGALENVRRFREQRDLIERLASLDRMKRDFLSTVSHELRTPLTVIAGTGRTLEAQWGALDDTTSLDLLSRLNANAVTLERVIAQLLDFSKLDAGQLEPDIRQIEVAPVLVGTTDRLRSLFRGQRIELEVAEGLSAYADPMLLERIVENLLSNASKYTPDGTTVVVGANVVDEGSAEVWVSDDGPGIPEHELSRIGERFFRGGDVMTRETRGTGLGLAVVSEILALHGSRLDVQSRVGEGTRFSFRLPRRSRWSTAERAGPPPPAAVVEPAATPPFEGERFATVLTAAATGIEWALGVLYRHYHPTLIAYLRCRGAPSAEEIAEQAWLEVARSLPAFVGGEPEFRRALFGVAREQANQAPTGAVPAAVSTLDPDQLDAVLLRVLAGLDTEDVALLTGLDTGTIRLMELDAQQLLVQPAAASGGFR